MSKQIHALKSDGFFKSVFLSVCNDLWAFASCRHAFSPQRIWRVVASRSGRCSLNHSRRCFRTGPLAQTCVHAPLPTSQSTANPSVITASLTASCGTPIAIMVRLLQFFPRSYTVTCCGTRLGTGPGTRSGTRPRDRSFLSGIATFTSSSSPHARPLCERGPEPAALQPWRRRPARLGPASEQSRLWKSLSRLKIF